ncbi:hypothetical protein K3250_002845 [Salmonella enterica subsp. enterica]|nr:hypothetical protein [Salmonella enterica subsp. enterica serovar Enteritidis]EHX6809775.1 hypothetical protein [Salmonella enterica subsp. enterica serovar Enteritidis]EHY1225792.1 hypothetical protein [Salmonella enterica subsp. enterica]EIC5953847.1 hypothetical protein [Salmonella enterica subsp. enterica serovar Enteritidis]EJO6069216.1 hypothetical protein [Salmonella enterica]
MSMNNGKIPKWVYDRIQEVCNIVADGGQMQVNRRKCLRLFLAYIWLESDENGWTIVTQRDIRTNFNALLKNWRILVRKRGMNALPLDVLPELIPELQFQAGKSAKNPNKRKSGCWRFEPKRPEDDIGQLLLIDVDTGEEFDVWGLLKKTGKAPQHNFDLIPKSQYKLKKREKQWLTGITRGRMHLNFIVQLKENIPVLYYKMGIRSLNNLYKAKVDGDYITYDHTYKLTFGGRFYDKAYQNLPGNLKGSFRSGLLNYDIAGCCLACLNTLFKRYSVKRSGEYFRVDDTLYQTMMEYSGLERKCCKLIVISTINRLGKVTIGTQNGIGEEIYHQLDNNEEKAKELLYWWKQRTKLLRVALNKLINRIKEQHQERSTSPRQYHLYPNDIGLILDLNQEGYDSDYARNKGLLAHMIMGVEQAYIREVVKLNRGGICMLDHDGFAAIGEIVQPEHEFIRLEIKE